MIFRKLLCAQSPRSLISGTTKYLHYIQGQSPEPNVREYFYFIDHQGMLFLDDAKMKNFTSCYKEQHFLKFFFKRLKKNDSLRYADDFPYLSLCGKERNFVRCDDLPIVFTEIVDQDTDGPILSYNHGSRFLTVPFEPQKICMMPTSGRIYHPGPDRLGSIGLISDKLGILWTSEQRFNFENGEENPPTQFKWKDETLNLTNELIGFLPSHSQNMPMEEVSENKNFVHHDIAKSQFFMILDHGITAYIKYEVLPHNGIHFVTTQVPESHKGLGLAKILVKEALDFCVTNKIYFKSSCWYINAYIGRNPSKSYNKYFKI